MILEDINLKIEKGKTVALVALPAPAKVHW